MDRKRYEWLQDLTVQVAAGVLSGLILLVLVMLLGLPR